jgi:hypothetical protein
MDKDTRRLNVMYDVDTYDLLQRTAETRNMSMAALVREYTHYCLTNDVYESRLGDLETMIRAATREASGHYALGQRSLLARQAVANATSMFLVLEVLAQVFDWSTEESQRFYATCRNRAVSFVQDRENTPSEQDG